MGYLGRDGILLYDFGYAFLISPSRRVRFIMQVLITGEVFGTLHVGANYMFFDGFSSAMGTLLLSKFVAQSFYDEHIIKSHGDSVDEQNYQCYGKECFRMSHVVVCLLSFTCVVTSFGVMRATKDVYRQ